VSWRRLWRGIGGGGRRGEGRGLGSSQIPKIMEGHSDADERVFFLSFFSFFPPKKEPTYLPS